MNAKQASLILDAHDIRALMENEEEVELLEQHNPRLLDAYRALVVLADFDQ